MTGACLNEEQLEAYATGRAAPEHRAALERHVRHCAECREAAATLVALETEDSLRSRADEPTDAIGRYRLLGRLGAGGMGVVYAAFDAVLQRQVAIKLLWERPNVEGETLYAEAMASAQVRGPNVVTVFEVGRWGDRPFMVMEQVAGDTLAAWLAHDPPVKQVLAVFRQAGAGLWAIHQAGLVHGDFKPSNVLVGPDGRAQVSDFGLTRAASASGQVAGTVRYMAPEQQERGEVSPAADQYSFCLALGRALTKTEGASFDPRFSRWRPGTPAWLRAVIARGLARAPNERFESMRALLEALDPVPHSRRRWWAVGLALGVAALGGGTAFGLWLSRPTASCAFDASGWSAQVTQEWNAGVARGQLEGPSVAATDQSLRTYLAQWAQTHRAVCAAAGSRLNADDPGARCLSRRRFEVEALVTVLPRNAERMVAAVEALPSPSDCAFLEPTAADATRFDEAGERGRAQASALLELAQYEEAASAANAARGSATGHADVRATLTEARARSHLAPMTKAKAVYAEALEAALEQGNPELISVAFQERALFEERLAQQDDSLESARLAHAAMRGAAPSPTWLVSQELLWSRLWLFHDEYTQAFEAAERAQRAFERLPLHPLMTRVEVLAARANALSALGRFDEARADRAEAASALSATLGPDHPRALLAALDEARGLAERGLAQAGVEQLRRVVKRCEQRFGSSHELSAQAARALGWALLNVNELDEAERWLRASDRLGNELGDHPTAIDLEFLYAVIAWHRHHTPLALQAMVEIMNRERAARPQAMLWPSFALDVIRDELELGQVTPARELLDAVARAVKPDDLLFGAFVFELEGAVLTAEHKPEGALVALERAEQLHRRMHTEAGIHYASLLETTAAALVTTGAVAESHERWLAAARLRQANGDFRGAQRADERASQGLPRATRQSAR